MLGSILILSDVPSVKMKKLSVKQCENKNLLKGQFRIEPSRKIPLSDISTDAARTLISAVRKEGHRGPDTSRCRTDNTK